jgi:hypothetical protein
LSPPLRYFCFAFSLRGDSVVDFSFRGDSVVDFSLRGDSVVDFAFRGESSSALEFRGESFTFSSSTIFSLLSCLSAFDGFEPAAGAAKADEQATVSSATMIFVFMGYRG